MNPSLASVLEDCCGNCENCRKGSAAKEHAHGIPISLSRVGEHGVITRIIGREETKRYLAGLGFTTGTKVSTVSLSNGSVILSIKGSKIAIDGKMASKIMFCPER